MASTLSSVGRRWLWLLLVLQPLRAQHPHVHVLQQWQDIQRRDWEPQQIPTRRPQAQASHLPVRLQQQLDPTQQSLDLLQRGAGGSALGQLERKRQEQQLLKQQQEQKDLR